MVGRFGLAGTGGRANLVFVGFNVEKETRVKVFFVFFVEVLTVRAAAHVPATVRVVVVGSAFVFVSISVAFRVVWRRRWFFGRAFI